MTKRIVSYTEYFSAYVSCINNKVFQDDSVPTNGVFSRPNVAEIIEDLISNCKTWLCMKIRDNILTFNRGKWLI